MGERRKKVTRECSGRLYANDKFEPAASWLSRWIVSLVKRLGPNLKIDAVEVCAPSRRGITRADSKKRSECRTAGHLISAVLIPATPAGVFLGFVADDWVVSSFASMLFCILKTFCAGAFLGH